MARFLSHFYVSLPTLSDSQTLRLSRPLCAQLTVFALSPCGVSAPKGLDGLRGVAESMEQLALSQRAVKGLGRLDEHEPAALGAVLKYFLQAVVTGSSSVVVPDEHEGALSSVSTLLLEAAKARTTAAQLGSVLTECGVGGSVAATLTDLYTQHFDTLAAHMEVTGIAAPAVVDIDWRLDYSIRSKHAGRECLPMFFLSLRVKDRGLLRDIEMIASQEDVQDLLAGVRDAVKQVDRVVAQASDAAQP